MKKLFMIAAAASLVATMANAQTTVETTTGAAGATVRIEPEYRTRIKSYVTEHKIRPVETRERIVVGAKVPTEVELDGGTFGLGSVGDEVSLRLFRQPRDAGRSGHAHGGA